MTNTFTRRILYSAAITLFAVVTSSILIQSCDSHAKEKESSIPSPVISATPVDAVILKPQPLNEEFEVTGNIVANQRVEIVSELTRKIVDVRVREGSFVRAGDLLFQLDDADLQAQLQRFRQQEKLASLNETRLKDLIENDAIVQQDYDEALTNLKVLQAQIDELEVMISKTRITAPFDGQVGMINTYRGAVVSVNTVLTDIEDNSVVKIEFSVPEKYAHKINEGSKHRFEIASDNKEYVATVYAKAPSLNKETRNLKVRALATNRLKTLLPGQSARINLNLSQAADVILIPSHALIPTPEGYSVLKVHNLKATLQAIEIGVRKLKQVEVNDGLIAGDTVITSNILRLQSGSPVDIVSIN